MDQRHDERSSPARTRDAMINPSLGIDALHFSLPRLTLPMEALAQARGIEADKLRFGLGLSSMAVCDTDEDVVTLAAEAAWNLIQREKIDPHTLGRIYLGTESAVDAAKPSSTYVLGLLEKRWEATLGPRSLKHCDALDMTFACVGGVDALHNSLDWVRAGSGRKALVIAAYVAKYAPESPGEYTQGAGAVALLITENPRILALDSDFGVAIESVGDFFKPRRTFSKAILLQEAALLLGQTLSLEDAHTLTQSAHAGFWGTPEAHIDQFLEHPVFDGPFSNDCYVSRLREALDQYQQANGHAVLKDWDAMVFHLPYAFQGRRMWPEIAVELLDAEGRLHEIIEAIGQPDVDLQDRKALAKLWSKTAQYKAYVNAFIAPGERASQEIGNMYTASIFMALLSTLVDSLHQGVDLAHKRIGFLSYGSGSKSKVFSGVVQPEYAAQLQGVKPFHHLDQRTSIDFATYTQLHQRRLKSPASKPSGASLTHIGTEGTAQGYRTYSLA